jgi:hypothetical protein
MATNAERTGSGVFLRTRCIVLTAAICLPLAVFPGDAGAQCSLPDLPSCTCYASDCSPVACPWPFTGIPGDIIGTARLTTGTRSCCIADGGTAYWQIQRQALIPAVAELMAFFNPAVQTNLETAPQAWCTETIAWWGLHAQMPYEDGYYASGHHQSSFVQGGGEMRRWYLAEEIKRGLSRGRWISATELDYSSFDPGVNGPCPGAYQQIYGYDPADPDNNGNAWNDPTGHSQLIDSMVVHRLYTPDGVVQRIDVGMIEGNVGYGGGSPYARIIHHRWYYDIVDFTPQGSDYLDASNRKIRGWGINLNEDGTPRCDCSRIKTVIIEFTIANPGPIGPDLADSAYVAAMDTFFSRTGGAALVTSNSPAVRTGGALPDDGNHWVIPPPPHPEDPVCIEVDLLDEYPDRMRGVTLEWVDAIPVQYDVERAGNDGSFQGRTLRLPVTPPGIPSGTRLPFTAAFSAAGPDTGHVVRFVRLCIPQSALTRTFEIARLHFNYHGDEIEDENGSSPEGDAGDTQTGIGEAKTPPMKLWLGSAFPNPFQSGTAVSFGLPEAAAARLTVHDVRGRRVRVLRSSLLRMGSHTASWDGRDESGGICPPGVYFVRLEWRGEIRTQKLVLVR